MKVRRKVVLNTDVRPEYEVVEESTNFYVVKGRLNPAKRYLRSKANFEPVPTPAPAKTYKAGDRVAIQSVWTDRISEYLLAQVEAGKVSLINVENGNRWSQALKVDDSSKVTHAQ